MKSLQIRLETFLLCEPRTELLSCGHYLCMHATTAATAAASAAVENLALYAVNVVVISLHPSKSDGACGSVYECSKRFIYVFIKHASN